MVGCGIGQRFLVVDVCIVCGSSGFAFLACSIEASLLSRDILSLSRSYSDGGFSRADFAVELGVRRVIRVVRLFDIMSSVKNPMHDIRAEATVCSGNIFLLTVAVSNGQTYR